MNFQKFSFREMDRESWNGLVRRIGETGYAHSWNWLRFADQLPGVSEHDSFVFLENNIPVAACSLALFEGANGREMSFAGRPLPVVAVSSQLKPSPRRKLLDQVFDVYQSYIKQHKIAKLKMTFHPLTVDFNQRVALPHTNLFEMQRYHLLGQVNNTLVVDLNLRQEELLERVSKYHRRHIKRSLQHNMQVRAFEAPTSSPEEIREQMKIFQEVHLKAAGRVTQSQATWDSMTELAVLGGNTLFANFLNGQPISYLYCGEYEGMATGWTQANLPEFEEEYSPRHLLEWETMLHYKKKGLQFYEVGERYYGPQLLHSPSTKEISISDFKERYGGFMLPKIIWTGYFEHELMKKELDARRAEFTEMQPLALLKSKSGSTNES